MKSRYDELFAKLDGEKRGAFIPFVVVGDPDMERSFEIIDTLVAAGADALELGIPFSDPVADGPVIQAAAVRALENGATAAQCFGVIERVRAKYPAIPIGILTYCNPVLAAGMDAYFARAQRVGLDSVLTADMPVAEADAYVAAARFHGVCPVFIAPPNADDRTLQSLAQKASGYTYVVTRKGVTGSDDDVQTGFSAVIGRLKKVGAPRPVAGFGISKPEHVAAAMRAGAAGAISGSAVVQLVQSFATDTAAMKQALSEFVAKMRAATVF